MSTITQTVLVVLILAAGESAALATMPTARPPLPDAPPRPTIVAAPGIDRTMAFGALTVSLLVFCRAHHSVKTWMPLGTFAFGMAAAVYGCMAGSWPLGLAVGAYSVGCLWRWIGSRRPPQGCRESVSRIPMEIESHRWEESRTTRMFGSRN